jgi:hypothetical protein
VSDTTVITFSNPREAYEAGYALLDRQREASVDFRHAVPRTKSGTIYTLSAIPDSAVDIYWIGTGVKVTGAPLSEVQAAAISTRPL